MKKLLNSTQEAILALAEKENLPKEEVISALVNGVVQNAYLNLGAAPNSPVHVAMIMLAKEVWELRGVLEEKGVLLNT